MNAPTPTLYSMLLQDLDGKLALHTPCTAPRCAKQSISPFEGSLVVGLVELYPDKVTGIQFWKALQLTQDQPDQVEIAVDVLTQLHSGSAESAAIDGRLAFAALHRDAVRLFGYFLALHRQEQGFDGPPRIEGISMPDLGEEADEMVPADAVAMREALVAIAQRLECFCDLESMIEAIDRLDNGISRADLATAAADGYRDGVAHGRGRGLLGFVDRLLRRDRKTAPGSNEVAAPAFDLVAHLSRQREWSAHTFGPGARVAGVVDHIRKELLEIEAAPRDVSEWIDVVILAFDGAWRSGADPLEIVAALAAKQARNEARIWPDWRTMPTDRAIEHDRSEEVPAPLTLDEAIALLNSHGYTESASALDRMVKRCHKAQAVTP